MQKYTIKELEYWDKRIQDMAENFGLDCYPQDFEICDYYQMLGYLAYNGMPSHYPHWSFGKAFEKQKTLYDYGMSGLPYEMVINSIPSLAYLMRNNSLALQILTIAHVYGHNDFFKNNRTFEFSKPKYTVEMFKSHADRIRAYVQDPSIGFKAVEEILDACHALSLNCSRNLEIKKLTPEEQKKRIVEKSLPKRDEFSGVHEQQKYEPPDLTKNPLEPEENILLFIRDYNPYLPDWKKDLLTIVHEETKYFLPQMETKIMNEGWASFWHYKILNVLELPQGLHTEFIIHHNNVIRPVPGSINPYHIGFEIFKHMEKINMRELFIAREAFRDTSFLRNYLTEELMRELNFFAHEKRGNDRIITDVSDENGWKNVKEIMLKNVGLAAFPVIKIIDANYRGEQTLYAWHEYEGRDLELSYAQETLRHLYSLWEKRVILESKLDGKPVFLSYDGRESVKITHQLLN